MTIFQNKFVVLSFIFACALVTVAFSQIHEFKVWASVAPDSNSTQGNASNIKARGTINSLIAVPQTKWIATGNWSLNVNNGNLSSFLTNMSFFDARGTATHTHGFLNFRPNQGSEVIAQLPNSSLALRGIMDVATNSKVVWKNVPTTIDIKGGKTITISVNDKATNSHFASQPILGVVDTLSSALDVQITPGKKSISAGEEQPITISVSDSANSKISGAKISGVMIDAYPGGKKLLANIDMTKPIDTSKIEGKKISGVTDDKGQFSVTETIPEGKRSGTYTIVATASADGFDPISKSVTFEVEK
jgi:hypothetical protein